MWTQQLCHRLVDCEAVTEHRDAPKHSDRSSQFSSVYFSELLTFTDKAKNRCCRVRIVAYGGSWSELAVKKKKRHDSHSRPLRHRTKTVSREVINMKHLRCHSIACILLLVVYVSVTNVFRYSAICLYIRNLLPWPRMTMNKYLSSNSTVEMHSRSPWLNAVNSFLLHHRLHRSTDQDEIRRTSIFGCWPECLKRCSWVREECVICWPF